MRLHLVLAMTFFTAACCTSPSKAKTAVEVAHVTGKVVGYLTDSNGSMTGLKLDSGVTVHFPAFVGEALRPLVTPGQVVSVSGPPIGGNAIQADLISNKATGTSLNLKVIHQGLPSPPPSSVATP